MRLDPAAAEGLQVVGEHRVHQQRHVPEQVVEQVRFLDVVHLVGAADPPGHRESAVGEVVEEVELGQQAFHAHHLESGGAGQGLVEVLEARDRVRGHAHRVLGAQERRAGAIREQGALAGEQLLPGGVVGGAVGVPRLGHRAGGIDRDAAAVGLHVLEAARFGSGWRVHGGLRGQSPDSSGHFTQRGCKLA